MPTEVNPDKEFIEDPSYFYNKEDTKSFKEIVLEAIERCRIEGSKQMTKGGEYMHEAGIVITAPDQRQVYINCVETLYSLLFYFFDDDAKKKVKGLLEMHEDEVKDEELGKLPEKIKGLTQKYFDRYIEREWFQTYREQAKRERRMVEGERSTAAAFLTQQREDERKALYMKVFVELVNLFKRKNELSGTRKLGAYD